MLQKFILILVISFAFANINYGQENSGTGSRGSVTGKVFDKTTKAPIEFSNVILFSSKDSTQVTGTVTNKAGIFNIKGIKQGSYFMKVRFMGYAAHIINHIVISKSHLYQNFGDIYLIPAAVSLQNVVVEGKRSPISYELDKKVIDVSQMNTVISGTAADVLENVPSVSVDIDGNVSLRGSSNFEVLIDGKPSVMSAQDALQQIPASSIKTIEIITNPSAKYDASGTAGIINIVLKKNSNLGLSGIADVMGGFNQKYGGNMIFQYRTPSIGYNWGVDYNRRFFPGSNTQDKQFIVGDTTSYLNSDGSMIRGRTVSGIRGGIDFSLNEDNDLSFGGRYGVHSFMRNATLNYNQWTEGDPQKSYYLNNTNHNHSGTFYELNTSYVHNFGPEGHQLNGNLSFRHNNSNEASASASTLAGTNINGTKTTEIGPESELRGKLDYTLPFSKEEKFSAGMEYFSRLREDINKLYIFDSKNSIYNYQPQFSHINNFNRTRFAAYSMFSNKWDSLGVQVGVRAEYTYQLVKLAETNQQFSINRWDFFPSVHSSYSFSGGTQVMASYTRRIERPDGGDLEPFYTWYDAYTVRIGNPSLQPELIDSYDLGYQTFFGDISFSNDFYYRFTHNKMEDINSVYAKDVTLRSIANIGTDYSLGSEFMLQLNPVKIWQSNLMGDVYDYRIKGALNNESIARESFDWRIKFNNVINITSTTDLQINARYHSPSVTAQGKWNGYFTTDLAVKQDFMGKKLSLTLQVRDLFKTRQYEFTSQGPGFYNYSRFSREAPMVMMDLKLNFNNYKENKPDDNGQNGNVPSDY